MGDESTSRRPLILALGAVLLVLVGGAIGYVARGGGSSSSSATHSALEPLKASQVGDAVAGRQVFTSAGCVACHSFEGRGGTDAPPLDFMRGKLSATDIADMSGRIWNHLPVMIGAFKEEKVKFPTFQGHQMADLIAYLHGGGRAPSLKGGPTMSGGAMKDAGSK